MLGELFSQQVATGRPLREIVDNYYMCFTKKSVFVTTNPKEIALFKDIVCWIKLSDVPELHTIKLPIKEAYPLVSQELSQTAMKIGALLGK